MLYFIFFVVVVFFFYDHFVLEVSDGGGLFQR